MIKRLMAAVAVLFMFVGGIYSAPGLAAGYQIQEQGVKGLGQAFAGAAAVAEDASTIAHNPAGLIWLTGRQLVFGAHFIIPQFDFKDRNSTNAIGGTPFGKFSSEGGDDIAVPNLYLAYPINGNWTFGMGVSSFYGLTTEYDDDWIGRYHAVKSDLLTLNFNPSLAYRVNDQFSLGMGVALQYADAELSNAVDFGALGFLAGMPVTPSTPAFDGFSKMSGDDWGFGFNLGMLYEVKSGTRIGLALRSEIEHTLEGDNQLTIPDFAVPVAGPSHSRSVKADLTIPATVALSTYHVINTEWAVMADITWTDWSVFDELRAEFDDGSADLVQPEDWQDSFRYSLGLNYRGIQDWVLRAGIAYDETPVSGAEQRTPRIPDSSRTWLALGASYQSSPALSFDLSYAHVFFDDARIDDTEITTGALAGVPVGNTLDGEFEGSVDIISAQMQWSF